MIPKSFQRLSARQWWWVLCAYARLIGVQLRIKLKQHNWLRQKLVDIGVESAIPSSQDPACSALYESVRLAARLQIWATACLPRSIVLADMLISRGWPAKVVLGVAKKGEAIGSHAWVEVNGSMVGEPQSVSAEFVPIALTR
jgi:hypothetical protein